MKTFGIILLSVIAANAGLGQAAMGTIRGVVSDRKWAPILGATIEAKNAQTRIAYTAVSSGNGIFALTELPPGQYAITVMTRGMKTYAHAYVPVKAGEAVEEDVELDVDPRPEASDPSAAPVVNPFAAGAGRDLYDQDGEFSLRSPTLVVNYMGVELPRDATTIKGKVVWIYVPERGRYWLSLAPRKELGFKLEGEVGENTLKFVDGAEAVEVDSADRIAPGSAVYNVYVLREPDWLPERESDRAKALLGSGGDYPAPLTAP